MNHETTIKQKWIDALHIIIGILLILSIISLIIYGISRTLPTNEEVRAGQIRRVESIKLCTDNNLDSYQVDGGTWYCKPMEKNYE